MAYTLQHSTGKLIIEETELLSRTAMNSQGQLIGIEIDLPGRNFSGYGKYYNQNLIDLLENYARYSSAPPRSLRGQFWFDTSIEAKAGEGPKGIMKYNVGPLGSTEWREIAAIGNDVYFNDIEAENIQINHDLTVYGDIIAEGKKITVQNPTTKPNFSGKRSTDTTFSLLNEHIDIVDAFKNSVNINIGKRDGLQIINAVRNNNVLELFLIIPETVLISEFIRTGDRISIVTNKADVNKAYATIISVDVNLNSIKIENEGDNVTYPQGDIEGVIYYGLTELDSNLNVYGDLKIEGGNITTDLSSFNLFPVNVDMLDIGKNASTIYLGKQDIGITSIRNNLDVDGDINLDGGDFTVSTSTFNFANTPNFVNAYGNAEEINVARSYSVNFVDVSRENQTVVLKLASTHQFAPDDYIQVVFNDNSYEFKNEPYVRLIAGTEGTLLVYDSTKYIGKPNVIFGNGVTGTVYYSTYNIKSDVVNLSGDLNIKGGDLLSNQIEFNILPENSTTINFGASATSIYVGNDVGFTYIQHDLEVRGGDLTTNKTTFNLLNTVAEIINFGGESNALYIGNNNVAVGHTSIRNDLRALGNFTVNGEKTYIDSDDVRIKDAIVEIGNAGQVDLSGAVIGDPQLIQIDGMDRGVILHYYQLQGDNPGPKKAFMGWDYSENWFVLADHIDNSSNRNNIGGPNTISYANMRLNSGYFNSSIYVGYRTNSNPVGVEIGYERGADGPSYVDFQTSSNTPDYDSRIIRNTGVNGHFVITNKGTGDIILRQEGINPFTGDVVINTNGIDRVHVNGNTGQVGINTITPVLFDVTKPVMQTINSYDTPGISIGLNINNPSGSSGTINGSGIRFTHTANNAGTTGVLADVYGVSEGLGQVQAGSLVFATRRLGGAETTTPKATIYSDGRMVVGTLGDINAALTIQKDIVGQSINGVGLLVNSNIDNTMTGDTAGFRSSIKLESNHPGIDHVHHFNVDSAILANSENTVVDNQYGFSVKSNMTGALKNYAFYSDLDDADNAWSFYSAKGRSFFGGPTTISVNSTHPALRIQQYGTGDVIRIEDEDPESTPVIVDHRGNVVIGHTVATLPGHETTRLQVHQREISVSSWQGEAWAGFSFFKSSSVSASPNEPVDPGEMVVVKDNETLSKLSTKAVNTLSTFYETASISVVTQGNPDSIVPSRIVFSTSSKTDPGQDQPNERVHVTSNGRLLVGDFTSTYDDNKIVHVNRKFKQYDTSGPAYGYFLSSDIEDTNLTSLAGYYSAITSNNNAAATSSISNITHFYAHSTPVTTGNQYAFFARNSTANGTGTNASFRTDIPDAVNNYGFYSTNAKSYFGGPVSIKSPIIPNASLTVNGGIRAAQGTPVDGNASDAGYAFGPDGDTGMFSYAASVNPADYGTISFYGNGVENVRIDSSGNLIILRNSSYLQTRIITTGASNLSGTLIGQWNVPSPSAITGNVIPRTATTSRLGGIIVGDYLSVESTGRLSVNPGSLDGLITPPVAGYAPEGPLGGIIVGEGLAITPEGVLSSVNFDTFTPGISSPAPTTFPSNSIRGFDAYNSTDFPASYYSGLTVTGPNGTRSLQLGTSWNAEEGIPAAPLQYRVNDDTGNINTWSKWNQVATGKTTYTWGLTENPTLTNNVGVFDMANNSFFVFPPEGYTMANLMGFVASIGLISYGGKVDYNDSMICRWYFSNGSSDSFSYFAAADRVRVWVQNTEQEARAQASWLGIWHKD